jgi:hypothetical protein
MPIQMRANGGLRRNAGDLDPALAQRIVAAVRKTPFSLKAAAQAVGMIPKELRYIIKRGSIAGADPLWEDTSVRCREIIALAEARNFRRLERAATGGMVVERMFEPDPALPAADPPKLVQVKEKVIPASVSAQAELQRLIEKDTWQVEPGEEDLPLVYMDLFSKPDELPPEILQALILNGWSHPQLKKSLCGDLAQPDSDSSLLLAEPDARDARDRAGVLADENRTDT